MPSSSLNPSKQVRLLSKPFLGSLGDDEKENLKLVHPKNRLRTRKQVGESKFGPQDLEIIVEYSDQWGRYCKEHA